MRLVKHLGLRSLLAMCLTGWVCMTLPAQARPPELPPEPPPPPEIELDEPTFIVFPTLTPTGEQPSSRPLRRPAPTETELWSKARELDQLLRDTVQDLGFVVDLSIHQNFRIADASERSLLARAQESSHWLLSPRVEIEGKKYLLRLVLVPPKASHAIVRTEEITEENFQLRTVVMIRDLIQVGQGQLETSAAKQSGAIAKEVHSPRSEGRAVLAVNAAVLGGFVGYSLQKSSGDDDARLTYPLMALGTGIGLGGSLLIAEEWDVGLGDAWYMSAGAIWPTLGGLMLAKGKDVQPETDRYAWGIGAGLAGVTLSAVSLSFAGMGEGGAAVAHSGGFIGTGIGAGVELALLGKTDETPYKGLGYGAMIGVLTGGILGRWVQESPSRIMMIDVGVGLGALSFAAMGSPLLIGDTTEPRERAWVLITMSGAIAGGTVAYWMTSPSSDSASIPGRPLAGVIGQSFKDDGSTVPVYGIGWAGVL